MLLATAVPSYFMINVNRPMAYRSLARRFPQQLQQPIKAQNQPQTQSGAAAATAMPPVELDRELLKTVFGQVFQETARLPHSSFLSDRYDSFTAAVSASCTCCCCSAFH